MKKMKVKLDKITGFDDAIIALHESKRSITSYEIEYIVSASLSARLTSIVWGVISSPIFKDSGAAINIIPNNLKTFFFIKHFPFYFSLMKFSTIVINFSLVDLYVDKKFL